MDSFCLEFFNMWLSFRKWLVTRTAARFVQMINMYSDKIDAQALPKTWREGLCMNHLNHPPPHPPPCQLSRHQHILIFYFNAKRHCLKYEIFFHNSPYILLDDKKRDVLCCDSFFVLSTHSYEVKRQSFLNLFGNIFLPDSTFFSYQT